jgi:phosphotriesterase-related protein
VERGDQEHMISRRKFAAALAGATVSAADSKVETVRGPIAAARLGVTLAHEHLFSRFSADPAEPPPYDEEKLLATVIPIAKHVKALGADTIVDCTAAYFGRSTRLLRAISEATGLHILASTGYYAAANDRYVPKHALDENPDQLAARWTKEFREGVDGVKPGHMKIGVDPGHLSEIDRKIVIAAARCHRQTGLAATSHTSGSAEAAREQIALFRKEGVSPSAWIWAHANNCTETAALVEAAKAGAWISLDGIAPNTVERHMELLGNEDIRARALLSHDGNSFRVDKPSKSYDALFTHLKEKLNPAWFRQAAIENPARAFALGVRAL